MDEPTHARTLTDDGTHQRDAPRAFYCVNDRVPGETTDLLREACERRRVDYVEIDAPEHYEARPCDELKEMAVRAVRLTRREFGGVDVLEDAGGRLLLLEANFPCYYPQAQLVTGTDIAGTMLDHLLQKATVKT